MNDVRVRSGVEFTLSSLFAFGEAHAGEKVYRILFSRTHSPS